MSRLTIFSKHWKQLIVLIVVISIVGTFITRAPGPMAKAEASFSRVHHLLHDADTDGRDVRPVPLLG
jgi:hypothetical protein